MSKLVKIPDMFLKASVAAKRKSTSAVSTENNENLEHGSPEEKKMKTVEKSHNVSSEIASDHSEMKQAAGKSEICLKNLLHNESWAQLLSDEFKKPYISKIESFLNSELHKNKQVFPPQDEIFTAFNLIDFANISVVIIGQDPYHDDNQAHGLSFSVKKGVKPPPSLKNIYKELESDIPGFTRPDHGDLSGWAEQGVFMLNATLTVRAHEANSHSKIGWQTFTDTVIRIISKKSENPIVFLLWGGFAHKKEELIDKGKHVIIKTAHPSPLSARKWWNCKCFSKCNEELENSGRNPIDWCKL